MKKDNSTIVQKVALRKAILRRVEAPVVLETHGGRGEIWRRCYRAAGPGVVFETDAAKARLLALQRPTWAVYQCDVANALRAGVGAHKIVSLLDVDPYGDPWPAIDAFFASDRPRAETLAVVVNDGLRMKVRQGGAERCASLIEMSRRYGSRLFHDYVEICEILLTEKAQRAGYKLEHFVGYYTGTLQNMTHYAGMFIRAAPVISSGT